MATTRTVLDLPDGRVIDLAVSGPPEGTPLMFHHGTPASGVQFHAMQRACQQRGLRLVTYSRPGYGGSSPQPGRRVVDVVDDVHAVLDHLKAPRCYVAGWSGGGPHAMATAACLPDRVIGALVMAGVAPYGTPDLDFVAGMGQENIQEFAQAVQGESVLRPALERSAEELAGSDAAGIVQSWSSLLPEVDRAVITDEFATDLLASTHEAVRCGCEGWLEDDLAIIQPWGFDLGALGTVPITLWQGDQDLMVPFTHGQWYATHLPPSVRVHLQPGHGHLSVVIGSLDLMLDDLLAH